MSSLHSPLGTGCLLASLAFGWAAPVAALTIQLVPGFGGSVSQVILAVQDDGGANDIANPTAVPSSDTLQASIGNASANVPYSLDTSGFSFEIDYAVGSMDAGDSQHAGLGTNLYFTVDVATDYAASGAFTAVDSEGRRVSFDAQLWDLGPAAIGPSTNLFVSMQWSEETPNESFVLGGLGGDFETQLSGSLTGTLQPGRVYALNVGANLGSTLDHRSLASGATAIGHFTFAFVPEPGTAGLVVSGLLVIAGRRRRAR
jgi:hypothetical protein